MRCAGLRSIARRTRSGVSLAARRVSAAALTVVRRSNAGRVSAKVIPTDGCATPGTANAYSSSDIHAMEKPSSLARTVDAEQELQRAAGSLDRVMHEGGGGVPQEGGSACGYVMVPDLGDAGGDNDKEQ